MAQLLKQSTTINLKLGQFVDKTDGVTPETALSFTVKLSKNGGTLAARNSATAIAHDADGYYTVELNTTDTNTLGRLRATVTDSSNALGVWQDFMVLPANVYDSLVGGSDYLQTHCVEMDTAIVTQIWAKPCETQGSYTAQQILSILLAAAAGVTSNDGKTLSTPNGSATRITGTVTGTNRTAITLAPSS